MRFLRLIQQCCEKKVDIEFISLCNGDIELKFIKERYGNRFTMTTILNPYNFNSDNAIFNYMEYYLQKFLSEFEDDDEGG